MAWTTPNLADVQSGAPGTTDVGQLIYNNLIDLDARVNSALTIVNANIFDDFTYKDATLDTTLWIAGQLGGANVPSNKTSAGDHYLDCVGVNSAIASAGICGANNRIRIYLGVDQSVIMEGRLKIPAAGTGGRRLMFGWQDVGFTPGTDAAFLTDVTDFIGFREGTTNSTLKFTMQKAGVSGASQDNLGNFANWTKVKITVARASAVFTVRAYLDDVEISGSPFSTNVPDTTLLRPGMAAGNDTGSGNAITFRADRIRAYWGALPDSP